MEMEGRQVVRALLTTDDSGLRSAFMSCCGSDAWVDAMLARWPFDTDAALLAAAEDAWWQLAEADWKQAFGAHPRIGEADPSDDRASVEQAGVEHAAPETLAELAGGNRAYESRFGHVFLICATGLDADQMLWALRRRLGNDPDVELQVAASEQARITALRLSGLAHGLPPASETTPQPAEPGSEVPSPTGGLSTHVLDTTTGGPAVGIAVALSRAASGEWRHLETATTDDDGRVASFDTGDQMGLPVGEYRLRFSTGEYFRARSVDAFHPFIDVIFRVVDAASHHHVPLLLSPFGYTTYRGS